MKVMPLLLLLALATTALPDSELKPMELLPGSMEVAASEMTQDQALLESGSPYQSIYYPYQLRRDISVSGSGLAHQRGPYTAHGAAYPFPANAYLAAQYGEWVVPTTSKPGEEQKQRSAQYFGPTAPSPYYPALAGYPPAYPTYPVPPYQQPPPAYPAYHQPPPPSYATPSPAPHHHPSPSPYQPSPTPYHPPVASYQPSLVPFHHQPHYNSHQPPNPVHFRPGVHPHNHQTAFTAFHDRDTPSLTALDPPQPAGAPLSPFPPPSPPQPSSSPLAFQTSFPHSPTAPQQPAAHLKPTFPPGFETTFPGSAGFETTFPSSQPAHPLIAHHEQLTPQPPLPSLVTIRPFPHLPPTQSSHPAPQLDHQSPVSHSTPPPAPPPPAFTAFTPHGLPALQALSLHTLPHQQGDPKSQSFAHADQHSPQSLSPHNQNLHHGVASHEPGGIQDLAPPPVTPSRPLSPSRNHQSAVNPLSSFKLSSDQFQPARDPTLRPGGEHLFSPPTPPSFASPAPLPSPFMRPNLRPPASGGFEGQQPSGRPSQESFPLLSQGFHEGSPPHSSPQVVNQGLTAQPHQFRQPSGQGSPFRGTAATDSHRPQGNPDAIPERLAHQRQPSSGEDWDAGANILQSLNQAQASFTCPAAEGHFPDPDDCSVYYQCAHGVPTRNSCQSDLNWNMMTNQCDWQSNVDCRFNKNPGLLSSTQSDHQVDPQIPEYMDYAYEDRGVYFFK